MSISRQVRRQQERLAAKNPDRIIRHQVQRAALQAARPLLTGKGKFDGNCNRTACQAPIKGANWFNTSTRAYYCTACARLLNRESMRFEAIEICVPVTDPNDQPPFPVVLAGGDL